MILAAHNPQEQAMALLGRLAQRRCPMADAVPCEDYDWSSPAGLTLEQLRRAGELAATLAQRLSASLGSVLRVETQAAPTGLRQRYGHDLRSSKAHEGGYWAVYNDDGGKPVGCLYLPAQTAGAWVARLLGAAVSSEPREMSALESALLLDVIAVLGTNLAAALAPAGIKAVKPGGEVVRSFMLAEGAAEYCELGFGSPESKEPSFSIIVATPVVLAAMPGGKDELKSRPADQVRKDLLKSVEQVVVSGKVWLGSAQVPVRDLIGLESGDVLLLGACMSDPVEMQVQGKTALFGLPAECDGHYALQVVRRAGPEGAAKK